MLKMLLDANGGAFVQLFVQCKRQFIFKQISRSHVISMTGIVLTNDGNAILREIDVSHPAAKVSTCPLSHVDCMPYPSYLF